MSELHLMEPFTRTLAGVARFLGVEGEFPEIQCTGVTQDSREIAPGDLFIALPGAKGHGAQYIDQIMAAGARAVLTDAAGQALVAEKLPTIVVSRPDLIAGDVASWLYNSPFSSLGAVGITGTNGKTTTATLLNQLWQAAGRMSGFIGTIGISIGDDEFPAEFTTPQATSLHRIAATMRERHVKNLVMEVSSHAIAQKRIAGAKFNYVAFTNLTQDHLDYHGSMENYFAAKAALFTPEYANVALINIDGPYGSALCEMTSIEVQTVSRSNRSAHWHYDRIEELPLGKGYEVAIRGVGGILIEGKLPLVGEHNLDNALLAVALAASTEVDPMVIAAELENLRAPAGRLEPVQVGQKFIALVDFAHTPDAVERALATARTLTTGKVIAVLGCGGDRDPGKRLPMGDALVAGSDVAVFTSDNPRSEEPDEIIRQMLGSHTVGENLIVDADRRGAIAIAVAEAAPGDCVIVLGKGHERGQEIAGVKHPFDDRKELARAIEALS